MRTGQIIRFIKLPVPILCTEKGLILLNLKCLRKMFNDIDSDDKNKKIRK